MFDELQLPPVANKCINRSPMNHDDRLAEKQANDCDTDRQNSLGKCEVLEAFNIGSLSAWAIRVESVNKLSQFSTPRFLTVSQAHGEDRAMSECILT